MRFTFTKRPIVQLMMALQPEDIGILRLRIMESGVLPKATTKVILATLKPTKRAMATSGFKPTNGVLAVAMRKKTSSEKRLLYTKVKTTLYHNPPGMPADV